MNLKDAEKLFDQFCRDSDGKISQKEVIEYMEKLGIQITTTEITEMLKSEGINVDYNGFLSVEGFKDLHRMIMRDTSESDMREAFSYFDKDGDGFITAEELRLTLSSLGKEGFCIEDCKQMIMKVDINGDGKVNFMEFLKMMEGGRFAASSS